MNLVERWNALNERLTGLTVDRLTSDSLEREVMRCSQEVRTFQSRQSLVLVVIVATVYFISFKTRTDTAIFAAWLAAIVAATIVRAWVCVRVERRLKAADASELMHNEGILFLTGVAMPLIIGTGYWLVCIPGDERIVFAITLLSAMYSIGSTINSMTQIRLLPILLFVNLGQGMVFFAGLGNRDEPAIALLLLAILLLELGFARRNSAFFRDSIRMRLENAEQNQQLQSSQQLVESSLNSARAASHSKSEFLAAASHDLRQPLHALSLYIDALQLSVTSPDTVDLVDKAAMAAARLRAQFDAILDLSSMDAGGFQPKPVLVELGDYLKSSIETVRPQADAKGLVLACHAETLHAQVDTMLLERLIGNLLSNAVRFTEAGSVQVHVRPDATGNNAIIEVVDTGIGIDEANQKLIFDDFAQLNNPARRTGEGTGLGLAIVRRLAEILGARVELESTPGEGSCFRLILPLSDSRSVPRVEDHRPIGKQGAPAVQPVDLKGHKILIVDDEPGVLDALSRHVVSRGGEPLLSDNKQDAIGVLENIGINIDFAIIDDMLGADERGLDIAVQVADQRGNESVIVVTGSESPERMRDITEMGIDVFRKPLTSEQLDGIMRERLSLA